MDLPPFTSIAELELRYDTLLLDAYGVLMNSTSALPGAVELIHRLNATGKSYYIVTNGSQLTDAGTAEKYQSLGLEIPVGRIISSGALIKGWARSNQLTSARFMALGPSTFHDLLRECAITSVVPLSAREFDVLVVGNQDGFPLVETMDHVISRLYAAFDAGRRVRLLLPNPDLVFPKAEGYGITAGMVAEMIAAALRLRYPHQPPQFEMLGKPYLPIFAEARSRADTDSLVLIGDQLATDILGAHRAGIDSAFIATGIGKFSDVPTAEVQPTYLLPTLQ